jgi:hypothetical protein
MLLFIIFLVCSSCIFDIVIVHDEFMYMFIKVPNSGLKRVRWYVLCKRGAWILFTCECPLHVGSCDRSWV